MLEKSKYLLVSAAVAVSLTTALGSSIPCTAQSILPAREDASGGGNPFEGLGRPDDPNPSRIGDYLPGTATRVPTQPQTPRVPTQTGTPSTSTPSQTPSSYAPQAPNSYAQPQNSSYAQQTAQAQTTPAELQALTPNDPSAPPPPPPLDSSAGSIAPMSSTDSSAQPGALGLPTGLGIPGGLGQPSALPGVINSLQSGQTPQGTIFGTNSDPGLLSKPDEMMPPPPPLTANSPPPSPTENTPLKQALGLTNLRKYHESIAKLKELDARQPNDPQIHYLLGVNYVLLRRYAEARSEYQLVERLAKGTALAQRATDGIRKISNK